MSEETENTPGKRLEAGDPAPDFSLPANTGNVSLGDFRGRNVVLYFYPKDDTPGCTTEACEFRDMNTNIKQAGAVVLGISPDDPASHRKFVEKFNLPFLLLSDEDHAVAEQYGVWQEKNMYGKKYMGVQRSTFLIGPDGLIRRIWPKVKVDGHAGEVLAALEASGASEEAGLGGANFDKAN